MTDAPVPLLELRRISKAFPGVQALQHVDLRLGRGETVAVIGENGAGKSTLMKIIAGIETADAGEIRVEGRPVTIGSVPRAMELGISLIHQELNLADNLDVGANIFLGREPRRFGLIDGRRIRAESRTVLGRVGLDVSPRKVVGGLPIGQKQLVEISKALSMNARILIMDEPTSSLSLHEAEVLFGVIAELKAGGVSILYISHRLGEVGELADRVVVLRDGANAGELAREAIDHDAMVKRMVGRDVSQFYDHHSHKPGNVVLEVDDLVVPGHPDHRLSFRVRAGEIVGIAGLVGAGRTELLCVLFGIDRPLGGSVKVGGKPMVRFDPVEAIEAGVALVPEDRKQQGLIIEMSVRGNTSLAGLRRHRRFAGFVNDAEAARQTARMIESLRIRTPDQRQTVQFLSGGNQQKVVLGKWLSMDPKLLLLDEPTRGIDVGAKEEIYALMERLAAQDVAVLFVSSEMEEVLGIADRVLVMHEGAIAGELPRDRLNEEAVMRLATGRTLAPASDDHCDDAGRRSRGATQGGNPIE